MPSNLNKIKIKDIRDFGISTVEYKGFEIMATEDDGEIVLAAIVSYDENSDAHVSVLEVCGDTMKEAKGYLVEEINDLAHTAEEIAALAIEKQFVGQYDKLVSTEVKAATKKVAPVAPIEVTIAKPVTEVEVTIEVTPEPVVEAAPEVTEAPKATNLRGAASREQVKTLAEDNLQMSAITFEQRGKYKDWYIMSADVEGNEFEQRLDVFKKSLRKAGIL